MKLNTFTIQSLFRRAKRSFVKAKNLKQSEIKLLTQFLVFLLKEEKVNVTLINNRFQTTYFRGFVHGIIGAIILFLIFFKC